MSLRDGKIFIVALAIVAACGIVFMLIVHPVANQQAHGAIDMVLGFLGGIIATGSHSIYTGVSSPPLALTPNGVPVK